MPFHRIKRRVEDDTMTVQMGIEGAGGLVPEDRRHDVAGGPVGALALLAHARGGERLQLIQRRRDRLLMRLDDPRVITRQCCNRNRLRR